jgi:hypothetical protein
MTADEPATLAGRLQRIATELDLLARNGATTPRNQVEWLDWSRVRTELWSISRALRQYRPASQGRSGADQSSLRDWVSRAQSAANQQRPAALIAALRGIQQQLAEQGRTDPSAERLARRTARLSAVLGASGSSALDSERLGELARETSAIAQRVLMLDPGSVANRMTPR